MVDIFTTRNPEPMQGLQGNPITPENAIGAPFRERVQTEGQSGITDYASDYMRADNEGDQSEMLSPKLQKDLFGYDTDKTMTLKMAQFTAKTKDTNARIEAANANVNFLSRLGSSGIAFALDPVQLGTMFIPGIGEARLADVFGKVGARAAAGASSMAAANAPIVAGRAAVSSQSDQDYTIGQAFRDELFGMGLGAVAHPIAGAISDAVKGTPEWARLETMTGPEKDAAARSGLSQMAQEMPVDIRPVLDHEPIRPSEAETLEEVLKNPELPTEMRTTMENRLQEIRDMQNTNTIPLTPAPLDQTMLEQQRLRDEGTMRATPQKALNDATEQALAAGRTPAMETEEELAKLTQENNENEAALTQLHADNPNFEETAEQLSIIKGQEEKIGSIYKALSDCFLGGGADVVD